MTTRRRLLRVVQGGAVAGAVASLAGCAEEMGSGNDDTAGDGEVASEDDREVRQAAGELNRALIDLAEAESAFDDPDSVTFDASSARANLEAAREYLDDAGPGDDAEELAAFADALDGMIDVLETFADADLFETVVAVEEAIYDEDLETADEHAVSFKETLESAQGAITEAEDVFRGLDRERLADRDVTELDAIEAGLVELAAVTDALVVLAESLESIVSGHEYLLDGESQMDDEAYADAADSFESAMGVYEETDEALRDETTDDVPTVEDSFAATICQTRHLVEASAAFREAAEAADDGDPATALDRQQAGEDEIDSAEQCTF